MSGEVLCVLVGCSTMIVLAFIGLFGLTRTAKKPHTYNSPTKEGTK